MNLVGKVLGGRYDIIEKIGEGGMATVYKAKCELLNRYVAVKVLKDEFSKDSQFVKRFRAEAQSAASLTHPNIVSVYDVGEQDGINYIVMECLEGKTLKDYVQENGRLSNETTLKFASQIASALEAAHKAKIIHRDIKPQNIVFSNNKNIVKVTDFGIAKMTTTNTITSQNNTMGSVHYFSPEHAKGCYIDEKSDIYSLGVVMYEMATGKLPFNADSAVSVALKQIQEEPVEPKDLEPSISDDLNRIIMRAMQKSSASRYSSATEMLDDIFSAINNPGNVFKSEPKKIKISNGTQIVPIIGLKSTDSPSIGDVEDKASNYDQDVIKKSRRDYLINDDGKANIENNNDEKNNIVKENKKEDMSERQKKRRMIIIIAIVATISVIVLGVLTFKLIGNIRDNNNQTASIETVPNVVGKNFEEVKQEYSKLNYTIELDKYDYSADVEEGNIIFQSDTAGEAVKTSGMTVVVSKGKKMITMPYVVGKDYTVAKYELDSLGLVPEFNFEEDKTIEKNIIKKQSVSADDKIAVGTTVTITVSEGNGKKEVIMPSVLGYTESAAKKALQKLKLNVDVDYTEDTSKTNGIVVAQSKKENEELEEGVLVTITVNRIQKTKSVQVTLTDLIPAGTTENVDVKVVAKVEGINNTIYNQSVASPYDPITVEVNGFTTATLYIYINGNEASEQNVTF